MLSHRQLTRVWHGAYEHRSSRRPLEFVWLSSVVVGCHSEHKPWFFFAVLSLKSRNPGGSQGNEKKSIISFCSLLSIFPCHAVRTTMQSFLYVSNKLKAGGWLDWLLNPLNVDKLKPKISKKPKIQTVRRWRAMSLHISLSLSSKFSLDHA